MSSGRAYGAAAVLDNALYMVGGMESMNQSFETSTMKVGRLTCICVREYLPCLLPNLYDEPAFRLFSHDSGEIGHEPEGTGCRCTYFQSQ